MTYRELIVKLLKYNDEQLDRDVTINIDDEYFKAELALPAELAITDANDDVFDEGQMYLEHTMTYRELIVKLLKYKQLDRDVTINADDEYFKAELAITDANDDVFDEGQLYLRPEYHTDDL